MRCTSVEIRSFRNHSRSQLRELGSRFNVISGSNGAGKTSIIEALSVAALTKSFTDAPDAVLVQTGANTYSIDARFLSDNNVPLNVSVEYALGPPAKKNITVNNDKLRRSSDLVGRIPIVALTPDDKIITSGSPDERRRFLSIVLSQASRLYLEDELELRKALKHRNSLLLDMKQRGASLVSARASLAPWTEVVIERSARIMARRAAFVEEFRPFLEARYAELSGGNEHPSLWYCPIGQEEPYVPNAFREMLERAFERREAEELRRGTTLVGSHRDELMILIDDKREARRFASQGQHKTLLVSMKLAEYHYLRDATGETPILLLDDVFSELDANRAARLLELLSSSEYGQTFITSTTRESFAGLFAEARADDAMFIIENGTAESFGGGQAKGK
ncbi:MAG TPA: DNA replication and repair protein RecF [Candidatus Kapabacteria bacterium]|nr:DNA replication and repair protein RecF [Candidatus Kapabacteria bacterium]